MVFMTPGTERAALSNFAAHLVPGGVFVAGFATDRGYTVGQFDEDLAAVGLELEHRFSTWDLRPWHGDAKFAVSVARKPSAAR